jgi:hypothetical protein
MNRISKLLKLVVSLEISLLVPLFSQDLEFHSVTDLNCSLVYVAKGDLEQAGYNGKVGLSPSFLGEYGVYGLNYDGLGVTVGYEFLDISSMRWYNKLRSEKSFNWYDTEIHVGISPFITREEAGENNPGRFCSGIIFIGLRNIRMIPPEFSPEGLTDLKEIKQAQQDFNEYQKLWDKKYDCSMYTVGWIMLDEKQSFSKFSVFYGDNDIGFTVEYRNISGTDWKVPIWINRDINIYLRPFGIASSFTFTWWNDHGWYYRYGVIGLGF